MSMEELGIDPPDWSKLRRVMEALPAFTGPEMFAEWFETLDQDDNDDMNWLMQWGMHVVPSELWKETPEVLINFLCGFVIGAAAQHIADS